MLAQVTSGINDFQFYHLIYDFLRDEIREFGVSMLGRMMAWVGSFVLALMTFWVMLQGYLIAIGQSRETLMSVIFGMVRATVIVAVASAMSIGGTDLHSFLTRDLNSEIHMVVTGEQGTAARSIDRSLAYMQVAMSGIDALQTNDDADILSQKARATFLAGLGTAGPAMSAAAMLLLFEVAIALFIGFGPVFILALLFRSTAQMFHKWIFYGIGTLFSMAVLSFIADLAMRMSVAVAEAFWGARFIERSFGLSFNEGISSQAMQQGGLGLLLTVLIISTPPMAAMFFQGSLGHFMPHSTFGGNRAMPYTHIQR